MPAITVDDVTALERLPVVEEPATIRPVRSVVTAPGGFEGEGFPVRRAFAGVELTDLDPFVHMDQMGEVEYAPGEPKGTPWHPHRGFETVTYMLDGIFEHQDSNGGGGVITNGDTQWMTAGAGILHIEKPPEHLVASGGLFHGIQLWVNLPKAEKWTPPRYQDLRGSEVRLLASADAGALVRIIAGELAGRTGPGQTYTPMTMVHATVSPGSRVDLPWKPEFNALVYVLSGVGSVGDDRRPVATGQLAVLGAGDVVRLQAAALAGGPFARPRGAGARRPADPGAGRLVRTVRDEHPGRARPGVRGLSGGTAGHGAGDPPHAGPRHRVRRRPIGTDRASRRASVLLVGAHFQAGDPVRDADVQHAADLGRGIQDHHGPALVRKAGSLQDGSQAAAVHERDAGEVEHHGEVPCCGGTEELHQAVARGHVELTHQSIAVLRHGDLELHRVLPRSCRPSDCAVPPLPVSTCRSTLPRAGGNRQRGADHGVARRTRVASGLMEGRGS